MSGTTLVGMFDDESAAQAACRKLGEAGIDPQAITMTGGKLAERTDVQERVDADDDKPGVIRRFFADLFGGDDARPEASHYSEAVRRGNAVVTVRLDDEARADEVSDILEQCGAVDVDERVEEWRASGYAAPVSGDTGRPMPGAQGETMKSVHEELEVGKRMVEKGTVRVRRMLTEQPVEEQVSLRDEKASIERNQVDRPASDAELEAAFKDKQIDIRETSEEPVVSKSARVVEEVTVGKKSSERTQTIKDRLRSSEVEVDNSDDDPTSRYASYSGGERRMAPSRSYAGVERRASA